MKRYRWFMIFVLAIFVISCAKAATYSLHLRYDSSKKFPLLQEKLGPVVGIAPFEDTRPEAFYIGVYTPLMGIGSYFESSPFPLEKALQESLSEALLRQGVRAVPASSWDKRPESLKDIVTDSIVAIEIRKFWVEGTASLFKTKETATLQLVIHLGVKKEAKVFTKSVEFESEMTVARWTPEHLQEMLGRVLTDVFEGYLSNPY